MEIVVRLSLVRLLKYNAVVSALSTDGGRLSERGGRSHFFCLVALVLVDGVIALHRPNTVIIKHIVSDLPHQCVLLVHAVRHGSIHWLLS